MTGTARSEVLARIRHASGANSAESVAAELRALGGAPSAALPCDDLATAFLVNVLKNMGTVDCAKDRSSAVAAVSKYLYEQHRTHRLVASNDQRLAAMPWRDAGVLPRFGALEPGEAISMSYARLGIAEIGAIVTFTGKANPAANNLLADNHVVLVDATDLVTDMEAAWTKIDALMDQDGRPRGINFIAGPSSTGDIEGKIVQGAHGPRHWHVILLTDAAADRLAQARALFSPA
jgi:L-lactate dehydrogenase complex protein LldG